MSNTPAKEADYRIGTALVVEDDPIPDEINCDNQLF